MSVQIAVIDDWQNVASGVVDWSVLASVGQVHFLHDYPADTATLIERLQGFEVICVMRERTTFDQALLQGLPKLKLLVTGGMRNAAIDIPAAKALGIQVCGTDSYKHAAPELTWALIMASTRNLLAEANSLRAGGWQVGLGGDLHGKTLGILGLGSIGQKVAKFGQAFGMRVIAWSENLTPERAAESGVTWVSKRELFEQADVLVNTARGPIVDEAALIDALASGRLAGAALDVYAQEPLPAEHPFRRLPNVLATPHVGYVSEQNYRQFYQQMIEDIQAWAKGVPLRALS
jgi:phosphoglycerate dehydrogenase-like enzyme